jgi:hypothetical protein
MKLQQIKLSKKVLIKPVQFVWLLMITLMMLPLHTNHPKLHTY